MDAAVKGDLVRCFVEDCFHYLIMLALRRVRFVQVQPIGHDVVVACRTRMQADLIGVGVPEELSLVSKNDSYQWEIRAVQCDTASLKVLLETSLQLCKLGIPFRNRLGSRDDDVIAVAVDGISVWKLLKQFAPKLHCRLGGKRDVQDTVVVNSRRIERLNASVTIDHNDLFLIPGDGQSKQL